jgi:membrane-associated protein
MLGALFQIPATFGYPLLFALVGLESSGLPLPGETALLAAAVLAAHGRLSIVWVIVTAAAGAIVGDNVGYAIGRSGLRRVLERPGWLEERRRRVLREGEEFFARNGGKAVFLARWVTGVRVVIAWLAGAERMAWPRFALWNALGGIAWATSVGLIAYYIGSASSNIVADFGLVGVAVAVVTAAWWLVRRSRARRRARSA